MRYSADDMRRMHETLRRNRLIQAKRRRSIAPAIIKLILTLLIFIGIAFAFAPAVLEGISVKLGLESEASDIQEDESVIEDETVEI